MPGLGRSVASLAAKTMASLSQHQDLPHFAAGPVVKGFGRGSKELGIPTANFPESVVESLPKSISTGIYYGLARVKDGPIHKMVMSVGWNPYYKNSVKSMETHIMHEFDKDFYGDWLRVIMLGYIRPERNFDSLDALIKAIKDDIRLAETELDKPDFKPYWHHSFITSPSEDGSSGMKSVVKECNGVVPAEPNTNGTLDTSDAKKAPDS